MAVYGFCGHVVPQMSRLNSDAKKFHGLRVSVNLGGLRGQSPFLIRFVEYPLQFRTSAALHGKQLPDTVRLDVQALEFDAD
jgi:hypothetical protein